MNSEREKVEEILYGAKDIRVVQGRLVMGEKYLTVEEARDQLLSLIEEAKTSALEPILKAVQELQQFTEGNLPKIKAQAEREGAREAITKVIKLLDRDHSKCSLPSSCMGYQNALSDVENEFRELTGRKEAK